MFVFHIPTIAAPSVSLEMNPFDMNVYRWATEGWLDGWMGGWLDGWMDGWMGGWVGGVMCLSYTCNTFEVLHKSMSKYNNNSKADILSVSPGQFAPTTQLRNPNFCVSHPYQYSASVSMETKPFICLILREQQEQHQKSCRSNSNLHQTRMCSEEEKRRRHTEGKKKRNRDGERKKKKEGEKRKRRC